MSQLEVFRKANIGFTFDLYKGFLSKSELPVGNLVFSPYALHTTLGMLLVAAKGKTREELAERLNFHGIGGLDFILQSYRLIMKNLQWIGNPTTFTMYNISRIYCCKTLKLKERILQDLEEYFFTEVEQLDFSTETKRKTSMGRINGYISNTTSRRLNGFISLDSVDENTRLLIINAMYFRGKWARGFKRKETCKKTFIQNAKDELKVDMMHIKDLFLYATLDEIDATAVLLPYKGGQASMIVILPNDPGGFSQEFLDKETMNEVIGLARNRFTLEVVSIQLPKFTIEMNLEKVIPVLKKLGLKKIFSKTQADFENAVEETEDDEEEAPKIIVSQIIQQTLLIIDEEGGAEITKKTKGFDDDEFDCVKSDAPPTPRCKLEPTRHFIADHPFYFQIVDHANEDIILFAGHCVNPTKSQGSK